MATKCPVCGAPLNGTTCEYCGYVEGAATQQMVNGNDYIQQPIPNQSSQQPLNNVVSTPTIGMTPGVSQKSKMTALLLCIFLGYFGVHRFYVGKVGTGLLYLCTLGCFGIGWFIDILLIATGSFKDSFDLPLIQ